MGLSVNLVDAFGLLPLIAAGGDGIQIATYSDDRRDANSGLLCNMSFVTPPTKWILLFFRYMCSDSVGQCYLSDVMLTSADTSVLCLSPNTTYVQGLDGRNAYNITTTDTSLQIQLDYEATYAYDAFNGVAFYV